MVYTKVFQRCKGQRALGQHCVFVGPPCNLVKETDRQTDILLTEIKVITDLFVIVIREIYVHVYTKMLVC